MKPAYTQGDRIIWSQEGEFEGFMGIIKSSIKWKQSFAYIVEGRPFQYIQEESIVGYEQKRALVEKESSEQVNKIALETKVKNFSY